MGGCDGPRRSEACPSPMGPDFDIGNSPILVTLPNGKRALFVGHQERRRRSRSIRMTTAPCCSGQPVGRSRSASRGRGRGAIVWGGAADARRVYLRHGRCRDGAVKRPTGKIACAFTAPGLGGAAPPVSARRRPPFRASSSRAPATASCSRSRRRRQAALGSSTPRRNSPRSTRCAAKGGAIATSGAVVVDGMVYVGSGYAISAGASGGNVLLAFGVE